MNKPDAQRPSSPAPRPASSGRDRLRNAGLVLGSILVGLFLVIATFMFQERVATASAVGAVTGTQAVSSTNGIHAPVVPESARPPTTPRTRLPPPR